MIIALLLAAACVATSDVPEFKARIHEACESSGGNVKAYHISGNHDELTVTMTLAASLTGIEVANTMLGVSMMRQAALVYPVVLRFYPLSRFVYVIRDGNETEVCKFTFIHRPGDEASDAPGRPPRRPDGGACLTVVK